MIMLILYIKIKRYANYANKRSRTKIESINIHNFCNRNTVLLPLDTRIFFIVFFVLFYVAKRGQ